MLDHWMEIGVAAATAINMYLHLAIRKEILELELRITNKMYKLLGIHNDN